MHCTLHIAHGNRWIVAIDMYEKVAKNIAPKREQLNKAELDHHESLEQLTRKKQQLREAQEKLKSVHDDMQVKYYDQMYQQKWVK